MLYYFHSFYTTSSFLILLPLILYHFLPMLSTFLASYHPISTWPTSFQSTLLPLNVFNLLLSFTASSHSVILPFVSYHNLLLYSFLVGILFYFLVPYILSHFLCSEFFHSIPLPLRPSYFLSCDIAQAISYFFASYSLPLPIILYYFLSSCLTFALPNLLLFILSCILSTYSTIFHLIPLPVTLLCHFLWPYTTSHIW